MTDGSRVTVFLMALGGPDSLENVEPYLRDLRGGRPTSPELVEEIRERYAATGGRSPVLEITRELAGKLEARRPVRVFVGLRHWHPFIAEAWADVVEYAPDRVVGICMAPQYSAMTVGKYLETLDAARAAAGGAGPAVGWYPLAPGEAWWPVFRHSPRYVSFANFNINLNTHPRNFSNHVWRNRPFAVTAVAEDDFRRGRPVYRHWQSLGSQAINQATMNVVPMRPELQRRRELPRPTTRVQPAPAGGVQSAQSAPAAPRLFGGREVALTMRDQFGGREAAPTLRDQFRRREVAPAVRDQFRAQHEQDRLQRDAERAAREQQRQAEAARAQQDIRFQREQLLRQQQEQAGRQLDNEQLLLRAQQDRAARMQQLQQERAARLQQWQQIREQIGAQPPRQFTPPPRPFVQSAPSQSVPVPQQQVRPVQQAERGWQRQQQGNAEPQWQQQGQGWQGRGHWR